MRAQIAGWLLLVASLSPCLAIPFVETTDGFGQALSMENDFLRLRLSSQGGLLKEFLFKQTAMQYAAPEGMGTEQDWKIPASREFLQRHPYRLSGTSTSSGCTLRAVGQQAGGGIDFLRVEKRYGLQRDSAVISLEYEFTQLPEAMAPATVSPQLHYHLAPCHHGKPMTQGKVFLPLPEGIASHLDFPSLETSRPWMALCDKQGTGGLAISLNEFQELDHVLAWKGTSSQTLEYFITPMTLEPGSSWKASLELIPFHGLHTVAGAGGGLVGELSYGKTENNETPMKVRVYCGKVGMLDARVFIRGKQAEPYRQLEKRTSIIKRPASLCDFLFMLPTPDDAMTEVEVILRLNRRKAARLNGVVSRGGTGRQWSIEPLTDKRASSLQRHEFDLTQFNSVYPFSCSPWGVPLSGGKISMLSIVPLATMKEVMYLARHLDLKLSTPLLNVGDGTLERLSYGVNEYFQGITTARQLKDLKKLMHQPHEVLLVGGCHTWKALPESVRNQLLVQVSKGTGLVIVGAGGPTVGLDAKADPVQDELSGLPRVTAPQHFLTAGIPFGHFSGIRTWNMRAKGQVLATSGKNPLISVLSHGRGRIVSLNYATGNNALNRFCRHGIGPQYDYEDLLKEGSPDYYYSLLAKAVYYASGRGCPVEFRDFLFQSGILKWTLESQGAYSGSLELWVTNRFQHVLYRQKIPLTLSAQRCDVSRELPPTLSYHGGLTANVILRDDRHQVMNWGSWQFSSPPKAHLTDLKTDKDHFRHGDTLSISGHVESVLADGLIRLEFIDSFKRTLVVRELPLGESFEATMKVENELPAYYGRVRASLMVGNREVDSLNKPVWIRPREDLLAWNDFEIFTGWPDYLPLYLSSGRNNLYRNDLYCTGFSGLIDNKYSRIFNFKQIAYPSGNYVVGDSDGRTAPPHVLEYRRTGNKSLLVNRRCLSDPKRIRSAEQTLRYRAAYPAYWAGITVFLGPDEDSLTGRWGKDIDYCFSSHCLKRFRQWLLVTYGSLKAINKAWNTDFRTLEDVIPFTLEEVRKSDGRHIAGWSDHLEFMDTVWAEGIRHVTSILRTYDKQVRFGLGGTPAPMAYGGMDWWKQMKEYSFCSGYDHGGQAEIRRSFKDGTFRSISWALGYAAKPDAQITALWQKVFLGYHGVNSFTVRCMARPDWTLPPETKAVQRDMRTLIQGTGKYFIGSLTEPPPTAMILYSQSSIRAAHYRHQKREHEQARTTFIALFRNVGLDFRFISYEQLAKGLLAQCPSVKLLALPDAEALSDDECQAILDFARRGGAVWAAMSMPGCRRGNCALRETSPLSGLFDCGHPRCRWNPKAARAFSDLLKNPEIHKHQLLGRRDQLLSLLASVKVACKPVPVEMDGTPCLQAEFYRFQDLQGNPLLCMVSPTGANISNSQGSTFAFRQRKLTYRIPHKAHVYDLVTQRYLGWNNRFSVTLSPREPHALLHLPQPIGIGSFQAQGLRLSLKLTNGVSTVVHCRVVAPDGTECPWYSRNLDVRQGKAEWRLPLSVSDQKGIWKVIIKDSISGQTAEAKVSYL